MQKRDLKHREVWAGLLCLVWSPVLSGVGISLPFLFESQSLYYKFGIDKTLLQLGKSAGLLALVLMVCQVIMVSGFSFPGTYFSLKRLFFIHKTMGGLIGLLAVIHPFLILGADGFAIFPFELRYWPEFTGVFLSFLILTVVGMSLWRNALKVQLNSWKRLHRIATPVIVFLAFVHARTVSETFDSVLPGVWLGLMALIALVLFAGIYFKRFAGK